MTWWLLVGIGSTSIRAVGELDQMIGLVRQRQILLLGPQAPKGQQIDLGAVRPHQLRFELTSAYCHRRPTGCQAPTFLLLQYR